MNIALPTSVNYTNLSTFSPHKTFSLKPTQNPITTYFQCLRKSREALTHMICIMDAQTQKNIYILSLLIYIMTTPDQYNRNSLIYLTELGQPHIHTHIVLLASNIKAPGVDEPKRST